MIGLSRDTGRKFYVILATFGAFQLIFLFQVYYANLRQFPAQCDCQCTKQVHISGLTNDERTRELTRNFERKLMVVKQPNFFSVNEEKKMKRILNAEDKVLDKEFHHNSTKEDLVLGDPDENDPYIQDKQGEPDKSKPSVSDQAQEDLPNVVNEKLSYRPLKLNPDINDTASRCSGNYSDLILIYVYSAPLHFNERDRVRRTWGGVKEFAGKRFRTVFFIGDLTSRRRNHYNKIKKESDKYQDIVQDLSYYDAYRNLTLKGISALQWVKEYCPNTYRVVKVDDDTLFNPYQFTRFLPGQSETTMSEIICKATSGVGPIRNRKSKYFVSAKEYPGSSYPQYCQGYGYIFPPYLIPKILDKLPERKLIAMEDVFFTGLIRESISARVHPLTAMFATTYTGFETYLERITYRPELLLIGHVHDDKAAETFWTLAQQRSTKFQTRSKRSNNKK